MSFVKGHTRWLKVDPARPDRELVAEAAAVLRAGGLVAFPTETVYGLGANALDGQAVLRIFTAKGRPADNPLIVHVAAAEEAAALTAGPLPATAVLLMEAFWPGPLTLVLPGAGKVAPEVSAGLSSVALRMPDHPVALALIRAAGTPVAAPSANTSGRPSPTTAGHVKEDLDGLIEVVLDGGTCGLGLESTVLDLTGETPVILRPGAVTPEDIARVAGKVLVDPAADGPVRAASRQPDYSLPAAGPKPASEGCPTGKDSSRPRSPGFKYTHYAPAAPLFLFEGSPEKVAAKVLEAARAHVAAGRRVGILAAGDRKDYREAGELILTGRRDAPATVAAGLYAALRKFDAAGVDVILAEGLDGGGVALAVRNRLRKAAGGRVIKV